MIAKRFLAYVETAPWPARAAATGLLAQAYLKSPLPEEERDRIEVALTSMLDDGSPEVRRALAEAFADSEHAPRHIVAALGSDEPGIAFMILERSPILTVAELVDAVGLGLPELHLAVAGRSSLTAPVAAALAQVGAAEVALRLLANPGAEMPAFSLEALLRRHGMVDGVARAVLDRPGNTREIRLLAEITEAEREHRTESASVLARLRSEAELREVSEAAVIRHAAGCADKDLPGFVAFLRRSGLVTSGLILRALLDGRVSFAAAMLGDLASVPHAKATGLVAGAGFWTLYRKADLPEGLRVVFEAALKARPPRSGASVPLSRGALADVVSACAVAGVTDAHPVVSMLRRMDLNLAREEARETRRRIVAEVFMDAPLMLRPSLAENERIEALAADAGLVAPEAPDFVLLPEEPVAERRSAEALAAAA